MLPALLLAAVFLAGCGGAGAYVSSKREENSPDDPIVLDANDYAVKQARHEFLKTHQDYPIDLFFKAYWGNDGKLQASEFQNFCKKYSSSSCLNLQKQFRLFENNPDKKGIAHWMLQSAPSPSDLFESAHHPVQAELHRIKEQYANHFEWRPFIKKLDSYLEARHLGPGTPAYEEIASLISALSEGLKNKNEKNELVLKGFIYHLMLGIHLIVAKHQLIPLRFPEGLSLPKKEEVIAFIETTLLDIKAGKTIFNLQGETITPDSADYEERGNYSTKTDKIVVLDDPIGPVDTMPFFGRKWLETSSHEIWHRWQDYNCKRLNKFVTETQAFQIGALLTELVFPAVDNLIRMQELRMTTRLLNSGKLGIRLAENDNILNLWSLLVLEKSGRSAKKEEVQAVRLNPTGDPKEEIETLQQIANGEIRRLYTEVYFSGHYQKLVRTMNNSYTRQYYFKTLQSREKKILNTERLEKMNDDEKMLKVSTIFDLIGLKTEFQKGFTKKEAEELLNTLPILEMGIQDNNGIEGQCRPASPNP